MSGKVMTVRGPADPASLGLVLPHEHVMSQFGLEPSAEPSYDEARLLDVAVPYLRRLRDLGCGTVVDCTTAYFGRSPRLLAGVSEASGVAIVTNTGYYAAAGDRYVPEHAYRESAEAVAARWITEWRDGIEGTGIRPGFIKTAVDEGPLSDIDRRLVRAALLASRETGLAVQTHVGDNEPVALEILRMASEVGLDASSWIWVHAHAVKEPRSLRAAAEAGAWVSLDGLGEQSARHILELLRDLRSSGLLHRALLSHDGEALDPNGGSRQFHDLMTDFIPLLERSGFTSSEVHELTESNPARALTVRERARP